MIDYIHPELRPTLLTCGFDEKLTDQLCDRENTGEETVFVFDSMRIDSDAYGIEIMRRLLPLLPAGIHRIREGDLPELPGLDVLAILNEHIDPTRPMTLDHRTRFHLVSVDGLDRDQTTGIRDAIRHLPAFAGVIRVIDADALRQIYRRLQPSVILTPAMALLPSYGDPSAPAAAKGPDHFGWHSMLLRDDLFDGLYRIDRLPSSDLS